MRIACVGLALAVSLAACGDDDTAGPDALQIRVQGRVTESVNATPLEGAVVTVNRSADLNAPPVARTQTDAQGEYSLSFLAEEPCELDPPITSPFSMSVSRPGYIAPVAVGFPKCTEAVQVAGLPPIALPRNGGD